MSAIDHAGRHGWPDAVVFPPAAIIEASDDAIIGQTLDGIITSWNPGAARLYGYAAHDVIGRPLALLVPPGRHDELRDLLERLRRGERVDQFDTVQVRQDGQPLDVSISIAPIRNAAGGIVGAASIARDITERKRLERELRRSRDELAVFFQSVADGITVQDARGQLIYANDIAAQLTGYPSGQALLEAPVQEILQRFDILDEHGQPFPLAQLPGRLASQGLQPPPVMLRYRVKATGEERWSIVKATPIFDEHGQVQLALNTFHDITALKQAEAERARLLEREQAARAAAEAAEQRSRFLAEASALLDASLDYEHTLQSVAQLAVPTLADWCAVHIVNAEGEAHLLAIAHRDPAKVSWGYEMQRRYPPNREAMQGVWKVLATGQPELYPDIPDALLQASAQDEEHLRLLRGLGFRSAMIVPLVARGRTLGALTFIAAELGRHYGPTDLALAQDLARRSALAVDNARLYQAEQRARQAAQESYEAEHQARAVAEAAEEQVRRHADRLQTLAHASHAFASASPDVQSVLDSVARQVAAGIGDYCIIRLLSEDGQWLVPAASYHQDPDILARIQEVYATVAHGAGEGLSGRVAQTGRSLLLPHLTAEELRATFKPEYWTYAERAGIHSAVIAPLQVRGRVIGTLAVWRNVTPAPYTDDDEAFLQQLADHAALAIENARLYREAETQRRRLQAVIDYTPAGVLLVEAPTGRMLLQNEAARQLSAQRPGLQPQAGASVEGYRRVVYLRADGRPYAFEDLPISRALRGETVIGEELTFWGHAGPVTILVDAAPVRDEDGALLAAVLVFQDLTQRKTLEQLKDEFLSLAAHELRTPLTVILGNCQLGVRRLRRLADRHAALLGTAGEDIENVLRSFQDARRGAEDMAHLIEELLDLTRVESGRLEIHAEPVDLAELVGGVVEQQRLLHPERAIVFPERHHPLTGFWDQTRLKQVFTNLLDNAIKYSLPGSPVQVRLELDRSAGPGYARVAVQDQGIGIPVVDLPHLFERHYRASNVGRSQTGLGLGLYLSSQIVKLHGGHIWAESQEREGSTFFVALPLDRPMTEA